MPTLSLPGDNWVENLGLEVIHGQNGAVRGRLECDTRHLDHHGSVHGGVIETLVETLASHAAARVEMPSGRRVVGVNNTTSIFHRVGPCTIRGEASQVHSAHPQHLWEVEVVREEDGLRVARGTVRLLTLE